MYNVHSTMLGEAPPAKSEPSFLDTLGNFITTGVNAGFNIYNKVQQVSLAQKQTTQLKAATAQPYPVGVTAPMTGVQPSMISYINQASPLGGYTIPVIVGGGALLLILALKK